MNSSDSGEVLRCPYNKFHAVARSRFQRHLVKCEKNYPPNYKVLCPYNATHRLSKSEIEEHINTCPMRNTVEASYIQPPRTPDTMLSEKHKNTSEIHSDVFSESQEMGNLQNFLSTKLRNQNNGLVKGNVPFIKTMNIGQSSSIYYDILSDESIRDDRESIVSSIRQDRMSNNSEYHRRFKMREGKK